MNPLVMKIVAGAITGAVLFTAGWTVRGWKDSGKIQKLEPGHSCAERTTTPSSSRTLPGHGCFINAMTDS